MNTIRKVNGLRLAVKPIVNEFYVINDVSGDMSEKMTVEDVKNVFDVRNLHDLPLIADQEFVEKLEKKLV